SSPFPCTTLFRSDLYPARVACRGISAGALAAIPSGGSGAAAIGGYFSIVALTVHFLRAGQQFTQPASIISNELRAVHLFPSCPGKGECAADRRKLVYDVRTSVATAYPCSNTRPESVPLKACKEVDVEDGQGCEGVFLDPHAFRVGHLRARRPGASRDRSLALDAGRSGNGNLAAAGRPL